MFNMSAANLYDQFLRRDILDALLLKGDPIEGRSDLISFLKRTWNLNELPSRDSRYTDGEGDIWQHMVRNEDWSFEHLYVDRLGILVCPDVQFGRFLEAVVHPLVRRDDQDQDDYAALINIPLKRVNMALFRDRDNSSFFKLLVRRLSFQDGVITIGTSQVEEQENNDNKYEVVLSFAGEDRTFVSQVAERLRKENVSFFYDAYEKATLWGKDLTEHLAKVYGGDARYCVMFISENYAKKVWTTHERRNAFASALERREEYVLPARFDDTEIQGLRKTIGYIDLRSETPDSLAELILQKLGM